MHISYVHLFVKFSTFNFSIHYSYSTDSGGNGTFHLKQLALENLNGPLRPFLFEEVEFEFSEILK